MQDKIFDIEQLAEEVRLRREAGEGVVLADGHFNIVHPGHQRFLRFCREKGDFLVVGVMSPDMLDPTRRDFYFPQDERAANVAAFALVDAVCLLEGSSADLIRAIRPDYYVKGVEFQRRPDELAPAVEQHAESAVRTLVVVEHRGGREALAAAGEQRPDLDAVAALVLHDLRGNVGEVAEAVDGVGIHRVHAH